MEAEADRVASAVVRGDTHPARDPRRTGSTGAGGGGTALPQSEREFFEPRFGVDFSTIRIHADPAAGAAAEALGARAFTYGHHVVFGPGSYRPGTQEGRLLLAHELTHAVQQVGGPARPHGIRPAAAPLIQGSFISWLVKMGAKQVSKGTLKNFIKTQIKAKLKGLANKQAAKRFAKEADQVLDILEDPWWVTAIGFIPFLGDGFDLVHVPKQIKRAMDRADAIERSVKTLLRIQHVRAHKLIRARLRSSKSYHSHLENHTFTELERLAGGSGEKAGQAAQMLKLIKEEQRLMGKI